MKNIVMKFSILFFLLNLGIRIFSVSIIVSPIDFYSSDIAAKNKAGFDFQKELLNKLSSDFRWNEINFKELNKNAETPRSFLDAMKISNEFELDFLIYGFVEEKGEYLHGELKLFDKARKEVIQVFYSSDTASEPFRLITDLANKIGRYIGGALGLGEIPEEVLPEEGIISFVFGPGYWTPITKDWADYMTPLYSIDIQTRFTPNHPVPHRGLNQFYFKTGIEINFLHSINKSGYEDFNLFSFSFGIPVGLYADIGTRNTAGISVVPQYLLDYLNRDVLYAGNERSLSSHFASTLNLEYQYHFNKVFSLGIINRLALQYMDPVRVLYGAVLFTEISLKPLSGGTKDEK